MLAFFTMSKRPLLRRDPAYPQSIFSEPQSSDLLQSFSNPNQNLDQSFHDLTERVTELLEIWEFMAKSFPEGSNRYNRFMDLNRQIKERYDSCALQVQKSKMGTSELLLSIGDAHEDITTLIKPEISKRVAGLKPLHRLTKEKLITRLINEGADPNDKTRIYTRSFSRKLFDALSYFPWPNKMYQAFVENPKRDVFAVSQSSDLLAKSLKQPVARESVVSSLLIEVRHVLDSFAAPVKSWVEQQNPSHPIAQLIGLHKELLGQTHLKDVHQHLLERDRQITGDFFRIITNFKRSEELNRYETVDTKLKQFFKKLGIDNIKDVFENVEELDKVSLKNSLEIQILYYLIAYVFRELNVNKEGKIAERQSIDYEAQVEKCLRILEEVNFSPAFEMHVRLNTVDAARAQEINLQGALLGNRHCQYNLCASYFSHFEGTLSQVIPAPFVFPMGINKEILIDWAKDVREEGYTDGFARIQNFMSNFFGAAGAYYQVVSPQQKERIKEMGEVVKAISGDRKVNQYVDEMFSFQGEIDSIKAQYKNVLQNASQYLVETYTQQFKRTTKSVDRVIDSSLMDKVFARHAVFEMLSSIESEMKREQATLQAKRPQTATFYVYPLSCIQDLKRDLVTKTHRLRYLHTNDPDLVMLDAEKILKELYQNVKKKEEVSVAHKGSLRSLKQTASKLALHILPDEISAESHRTKAIAASYNLYQAARKINAGNSPAEQMELLAKSGSKSPRTTPRAYV